MKGKIQEHAVERRKEIGDRIREVRDNRGVSQEALAKEIGCSRVKLNRVENGRAELSTTEIDSLANACMVRISIFFEPLNCVASSDYPRVPMDASR